MQNDFAARADWCVADSFSKANHAPQVEIEEGLNVLAEPGETVTLHAKATDPDNDRIFYKWWRYFEADSYQDDKRDKPDYVESGIDGFLLNYTRPLLPDEILNSIQLDGVESDTVSFKVPEDALGGDTIHIILEVQDNGAHRLKKYKRVIVTVR